MFLVTQPRLFHPAMQLGARATLHAYYIVTKNFVKLSLYPNNFKRFFKIDWSKNKCEDMIYRSVQDVLFT